MKLFGDFSSMHRESFSWLPRKVERRSELCCASLRYRPKVYIIRLFSDSSVPTSPISRKCRFFGGKIQQQLRLEFGTNREKNFSPTLSLSLSRSMSCSLSLALSHYLVFFPKPK